MLHSLSHQGITKDAYLQIARKTEEEILAEARPDAEQALRREAVIAAVIEAEEIEPSDGDMLDALAGRRRARGHDAREAARAAATAGRLDDAREDLAAGHAVDSWPTPRRRSPSSRPRRATSSGRPARTPWRRGAEKLWTPGS